MTDSSQLLRAYADHGDETAFRELVTRYVNLVYSVAFRQTGGNAPLAEEVVQNVFTDLARRAGSLHGDTLGGWLHRHACFLAATARRGEQRRRVREQMAAEMNALNDSPEAAWRQLAPVLDEAVNQLGATDRHAVVLRFYEGRDLRTVGRALGTSEDGAQKRVRRALEKLRAFLVRRGVSLSVATLASLLAGQAVSGAPAGLAASVAGPALAAAAAGGGFLFTLLKFMTTTQIKTGIAGAVLLTTLGTALVLQQKSQDRLRAENRALREQTNAVEQLRADNARLAALKVDADELARLRQEQSELMRLRAEVAKLRRDALTNSMVATTQAPPPAPAEQPRVVLQDFHAQVGNGATLVTGGWTTSAGKRMVLLMTPEFVRTSTPDAGGVVVHNVTVTFQFVEGDEAALAQSGLGNVITAGPLNAPRQTLSPQQMSDLTTQLTRGSLAVQSAPRLSVSDGQQATITTGSNQPGGPDISVELTAHVAADEQSVGLSLNVLQTPQTTPPESSGVLPTPEHP
jgi:RNA polymerase sigma factor (sigma-70 family)